MSAPRIPPEERFWPKIEQRGECWVWTGEVCRKGYGRFASSIRRNGRAVRVKVHRWAYEHFVGPIPEGLQVLHRCDNPPCCNPAHLFVGTQSENMRDCVAKGRHDAHRKLTIEQVAAIRSRPGEHHRDLAREFGVGKATITDLLAGKTYA